MAGPLFTGSAIERVDLCAASVALPAVEEPSEHSDRGTAIHRYLEELPEFGPETALAGVPDEWRAACAALDLSGLETLLATAGGAEIAIAVNVRTWIARELGRGVGRDYRDVTEDEVPCTLDAIRIDHPRGLVVDYKTGWRRHVAGWQLQFGALAAHLLWQLDEVDVQQINVSDRAPWVRRACFSGYDFRAIRDDLARVHARALARRREHEAGRVPSEFTVGDHCRYCPARRVCPAQTAQIRGALGLATTTLAHEEVDAAAIVELRDRVKAALKALHVLNAQIDQYVTLHGPLPIGAPDADGYHWLAEVISEGNEKITGTIARTIVSGLYGAEAGEACVTVTATKKQLETAIRAAVPRGRGAGAIKEALELIRAAGGASRKTSLAVEEVVTRDATPPPAPSEDRLREQLRRSLSEDDLRSGV